MGINIERNFSPEMLPPGEEDLNEIETSDGDEVNIVQVNDLEYISRVYLKGPRERFQSREGITWDEYAKEISEAEERFAKDNEGDEEILKAGKILFLSVLVIESTFARNRKKNESSHENLALKEAEWAIEMAKYYWTNRDNGKIVIEVINYFLKSFEDISRSIGRDKAEIEGHIRGFKGLLSLMNTLDKLNHEIRLPSPKEDAEDKIDLFSYDPKKDSWVAWQIKTTSKEPLFIGEASENFYNYDNTRESKKFASDIRTLAKAAKDMSQKGLTIAPRYIIIPEHLIKENFQPERDFLKSVSEYDTDGEIENVA